MTDRIFAVIWLAVCGYIVFAMLSLSVPFSYEPVGPKAFPILLAALMAVCCVILIFRPDDAGIRINREPAVRGITLILILLGYALTFEFVGFPLATAMMVALVARLFGSTWRAGIITAVVLAASCYVVFDRLLEVSLPLGRVWS